MSRIISETSAASVSSILAGTPGFQPPEQLEALNADIKCDVYAVGAVLVEIFGEKPIWDKLMPTQIICKVAVEKKLPDVSHLFEFPWLQELCLNCFAPRETRINIALVLLTLCQKIKQG